MATSTAVSYIRSGSTIAEVELEGDLLPIGLPEGLLERRKSGVVEIIEATGTFAEFCGTLHLVGVLGSRLTSANLKVPPPALYTDADVKNMWLARSKLHDRRRTGLGGSYDWGSLRARGSNDLLMRHLQGAQRNARSLLASWPTRGVRQTAVLPVDRSGGRILVGPTERAARAAIRQGVRTVPEQTVRATFGRDDARYQALSAVSSELLQRVKSSRVLAAEGALVADLSALFAGVARRSAPISPRPDPPMSTWPPPIAATYWSFLAAVSVFEDIGAGQDSAPLSPLWELYEGWVAQELVEQLDIRFGVRARVEPDDGAVAAWAEDGSEVSLYYQETFPPLAGLSRRLGPVSVGSVVGELVPDVVIRRSNTAGTALVIIDAKNYGRQLGVADLSDNASKYLWGVRRAEIVWGVPPQALSYAFIASPLGGSAEVHPSSRATIIEMHPNAGPSTVAVDDVMAQLRVIDFRHTGMGEAR